jgi:hypothetical protein
LHDAGERPGYRGDTSASIQGGSGTVQAGKGNQSARGPGNRQFDARNWTGATRPDQRYDVPGRADMAVPQDLLEGIPNQDLAPAPATPTPFTQNNRRGTHAILSPSLVYAARNRGGRILSPRVADATAAMLARAPLVRLSLHPPDARYPELVRHIQQTLVRLLESREAVTKAEFASRVARRLAPRLTSTDPTSHPASHPDSSHSSPQAVQSAADRTSP